ncbi:MAG: hypothetical protein KatS3mg005_0737 [Bryobacteraceae bacterium]|nr:MAG: hypothetical protein KatS3mg005_0737 [Bryobacteraceae bacterium]
MTTRRAVLPILLLAPAAARAGVGKKEVRYLGGVWTDVPEGTEGKIRLDDDAAVFVFEGRQYRLPYASITSLEYGQKVGRRVGATIGWGATTLGIAALPMLLSKKRRHFATIGYTDEQGKPQGLVVEFGKEINRSAMKMLSLKSGKEIEFESGKAREEFYH